MPGSQPHPTSFSPKVPTILSAVLSGSLGTEPSARAESPTCFPGFAVGWGPIPWLLMSEIFPLHVKGVATGVCVLTNWLMAFLVTKEFSSLMVSDPRLTGLGEAAVYPLAIGRAKKNSHQALGGLWWVSLLSLEQASRWAFFDCVTWDQFFTGCAQASLVGVERTLIQCHLLVGTWHSQGCSPKFFPAAWGVGLRVEPAT